MSFETGSAPFGPTRRTKGIRRFAASAQKRASSRSSLAHRRLWSSTVVGLAAILAAAACSSGSSSSGSTSSASTSNNSSSKDLSLTIAVAAAASPFATIYIAQTQGYYAKEGLQVNLINNAANTGVTLVTSGKADLTAFGPGPALSLISQGKPAELVYDWKNGGTASVEVLNNGKIKSLVDLGGQRIAVGAVGGSSYGYAALYSAYNVAHGGKPFDLVPYTSTGEQVDAVTSGQAAAAVVGAAYFEREIESNQVKLLLDAADQSQVSAVGVPPGVPEDDIWGLKADLSSKSEAVTRFLAALDLAENWIQSHTPAQIAASLKTLPIFAPTPLNTLTGELVRDKPFLLTNFGKIPQSNWDTYIHIFSLWGIPGVKVNEANFPYDKVIDMSYANAAEKLITGQ